MQSAFLGIALARQIAVESLPGITTGAEDAAHYAATMSVATMDAEGLAGHATAVKTASRAHATLLLAWAKTVAPMGAGGVVESAANFRLPTAVGTSSANAQATASAEPVGTTAAGGVAANVPVIQSASRRCAVRRLVWPMTVGWLSAAITDAVAVVESVVAEQNVQPVCASSLLVKASSAETMVAEEVVANARSSVTLFAPLAASATAQKSARAWSAAMTDVEAVVENATTSPIPTAAAEVRVGALSTVKEKAAETMDAVAVVESVVAEQNVQPVCANSLLVKERNAETTVAVAVAANASSPILFAPKLATAIAWRLVPERTVAGMDAAGPVALAVEGLVA